MCYEDLNADIKSGLYKNIAHSLIPKTRYGSKNAMCYYLFETKPLVISL